MENLALKARQFPTYFIDFKDNPTQVLNEIDDLVNSALAQHFPRHLCLICRNVFKTRAEALRHAQSHPRPTTRQQNSPSQIIRDSSYTIYSCHKCQGTYTNRSALVSHMHSHTERKIYKCKICSYGAQYFCQIQEHILRTHAHKTNLYCLECPMGHAPYFHNTLAYLNHLDHTHHNDLGRHLGTALMDPPELPVNLEVSLQYCQTSAKAESLD